MTFYYSNCLFLFDARFDTALEVRFFFTDTWSWYQTNTSKEYLSTENLKRQGWNEREML